MEKSGLTALLAGRKNVNVTVAGWDGWSLRLLSAAEVLEARREVEELVREDRERAVCSNACLLARALAKDGRAVFSSGSEVLAALRVEEVATLTKQWAEFNRAENPSPEDGEERIDGLKKAWSTRRMSALNGACSKLLGCFRVPNRRGN